VQQLADALDLGEDDRAAFAAAARRIVAGIEAPLEVAAAPSPPTNLSPEPTSFIGRQREIAAISELLAQPVVRLVTLTGPGGIGKTRVAVHLAALLLAGVHAGETAAYPDGVFWDLRVVV
jgi:Mrp family chromosome partitioning ATPase